MPRKFKVGIIGFGRMGRGFAAALLAHPSYDVAAVCDVRPAARTAARRLFPQARITADAEHLLGDQALDVAGLFTLADERPAQLRRALAAGKHVIAEKPLAADVKTEWSLVKLIEKANRRGLLVAVNLFNRNAWYHREILAHIAAGEIGTLAIIRVCHMTPGHMPGEGHEPEGPPFHDCGMHYVDLARWYAAAEYKTWHAQGIRMWSHHDPWWVQCHGTFANGVVFDITQGFVYGHLAKDKTHNCYLEAIGTRGVARLRHDFKNAAIEVHGVRRTVRKTAPFNDKKLDVMVDIFARSLKAGRDLGLPAARDAALASATAWAMLRDARRHDLPAVGERAELDAILAHRRSLREGFGLPVRETPCGIAAMGHIEEAHACGEDVCGPAARRAS